MISACENGYYLAQPYMPLPAVAAILTRLFFYKNRFRGANPKIRKAVDNFKNWAFAAGITLLSFFAFPFLGAVRWDLSGKTFLDTLERQFALTGQSIYEELPPDSILA